MLQDEPTDAATAYTKFKLNILAEGAQVSWVRHHRASRMPPSTHLYVKLPERAQGGGDAVTTRYQSSAGFDRP